MVDLKHEEIRFFHITSSQGKVFALDQNGHVWVGYFQYGSAASMDGFSWAKVKMPEKLVDESEE